MTQPTVGSVAQQLYDALTPLAFADEACDWSLLYFLAANGQMVQQIDTYASDTPDGDPGWSILLDIDRCPDEALGYIAQCCGVSLLAGATSDQSRLRIRSTDGMKRGTPSAVIGAAQQALIAGQRVTLRERYNPANPSVDSPYHFEVTTYTAETPDADELARRVEEQKPAGNIAHTLVVDGQDWQRVEDDYATWADVATAYATWEDVADDTP